jgi:hypothetical protein
MANDKGSDGKRKAPAHVVNGTRVTVAFPFSKITATEPSDDLRELANLVADLADALAHVRDDDVTTELRERATALRDRLETGVMTRT